MPLPGAACTVLLAQTRTNTTEYRISPFSGNLYAMVTSITGGGLYQYVRGGVSFTSAPYIASNASTIFVPGTTIAVESFCTSCKSDTWFTTQNIASLPSGNTIITVNAMTVGANVMLDVSAPPALPAQLNNGPFFNFSTGTSYVNRPKGSAGLVPLSNATVACHGQDSNGNFLTTVYNRLTDSHTVIGAANGTSLAAMSFAASTGVLYLSGTNMTNNAIVLLLVVAQAPYTNVTFANTTGFQTPLASFTAFQ